MAAKINHKILEAKTDKEITSLFPVLRELGPHVASEQQLLKKVRNVIDNEGCHYIYIVDTLEEGESKAKPVSAMSYRILHNLFDGKFMYIADMVTLPAARKKGHAGALVDYAMEKAREEKCDVITLDSIYTREEAHRFYINKGFTKNGHHFNCIVNADKSSAKH